jgi:ankyrin repeat protein
MNGQKVGGNNGLRFLPIALMLLSAVFCGCETDDAVLHRLIEARRPEEKVDRDTQVQFRRLLTGNDRLVYDALLGAHGNQDPGLMIFLLEDSDIRARRILSAGNYRTLLDVCCNGRVMKNLLESENADPHSLSAWTVGSAPLLIHAQHGNECEARRELLRHYCDVNIRNRRGFTPLHYAAWRGGTNSINELLEFDADIKATSYSKKSVLHLAALRPDDDPRAAELLLNAGADVNAADKWGNTPLFYACAAGNKRILTFLLKHGADEGVKNREGKLYHSAKLTALMMSTAY